jgi:UDP-GlcNAc:undecaprenyl-phosphate GlcNAc-1-phosphate transferase
VPNIGGIAIFGAIILPLAGLLVWASAGSVHPVAQALRIDRDTIAVLIVCMFALHTMGLMDDRKPLPAIVKLAAMVFVATAVVGLLDIRLLTVLDAQPGGVLLSMLLSIVWIVAITNAINFLDNMDGVCAGVTAVIAAVLVTVSLRAGDVADAIVLGCLAGAALGFLVWNRPRASIFMGDGGSLVLGFLLGVMAIRVTYFDSEIQTSPWTAVFVPLALFAVPIYDLCSVVVIRLSQGRNPFVGDQQHFTHRMKQRGLSDRRTLFVVLGCCIITGLSGLLMLSLPPQLAPIAALQVLLTLLVLGVYERGVLKIRAVGGSGR